MCNAWPSITNPAADHPMSKRWRPLLTHYHSLGARIRPPYAQRQPPLPTHELTPRYLGLVRALQYSAQEATNQSKPLLLRRHPLLPPLRCAVPLSRSYEAIESGVKMVVLVVATTTDPASFGPANAFLTMPGWKPIPSVLNGMETFENGKVRVLKHGKGIVDEDDLDRRWEEATGEVVEELVFLSKHISATNTPAITVHPIGVPHLGEDEVPLQGGKPGWAGPPNPRIGPWLRLLKRIAESKGLVPEFEITLEATHHGPVVSTRTLFVEIGSTEEYWRREDAANAVAQLLWEGLGLDGGDGVGKWNRENEQNKVLLGIGGGHYVPRQMDIVKKDGVWVGHLLSGYSLPMEDPSKQKPENSGNGVGGRWKQAIKVAYEATKSAFPQGEIIAYMDQKSFRGWQKNAILKFLAEEKIKVGKPSDFV